ncbi:hypothetical protein MKW98_023881 [Papaver atlanticum]|uniref:Uncharacterized protein n=1 Tax=Papaver atlanticum TaxID=357466 RepID=A0AAD4XL48_9MAGN|nr:hypothetical protein MKW98_023881 [Papaver atlanticum]
MGMSSAELGNGQTLTVEDGRLLLLGRDRTFPDRSHSKFIDLSETTTSIWLSELWINWIETLRDQASTNPPAVPIFPVGSTTIISSHLRLLSARLPVSIYYSKRKSL